MRRGIEFNSMNSNGNQTTTATHDVNTTGGDGGSGGISSSTSILLAIYFTGVAGASPIYGYLSKCISYKFDYSNVTTNNILLFLFS